ncbi:hypothetical protein NGRA_1807 [Nosema granulosis]|uniref:Uncharacterized protein n=1 Tax=Nosema granulosis TaxID=83296 RepID=A0A9P6H0I3_9MICR|nr:hypothetical protein NGRA_1807 [Nosema granulosis]
MNTNLLFLLNLLTIIAENLDYTFLIGVDINLDSLDLKILEKNVIVSSYNCEIVSSDLYKNYSNQITEVKKLFRIYLQLKADSSTIDNFNLSFKINNDFSLIISKSNLDTLSITKQNQNVFVTCLLVDDCSTKIKLFNVRLRKAGSYKTGTPISSNLCAKKTTHEERKAEFLRQKSNTVREKREKFGEIVKRNKLNNKENLKNTVKKPIVGINSTKLAEKLTQTEPEFTLNNVLPATPNKISQSTSEKEMLSVGFHPLTRAPKIEHDKSLHTAESQEKFKADFQQVSIESIAEIPKPFVNENPSNQGKNELILQNNDFNPTSIKDTIGENKLPLENLNEMSQLNNCDLISSTVGENKLPSENLNEMSQLNNCDLISSTVGENKLPSENLNEMSQLNNFDLISSTVGENKLPSENLNEMSQLNNFDLISPGKDSWFSNVQKYFYSFVGPRIVIRFLTQVGLLLDINFF